MIRITLNKEQLKQQIKAILLEKIASYTSSNTYTHTNSSGSLSPAEWWVDGYYGSIRHSLSTDISVGLVGDTIRVELMYEVIDISPTTC